jgi:hypothetical protein
MGNALMRPTFHHTPTEEEGEEAFTHTLVVQKVSGNVVMSSEDELGS